MSFGFQRREFVWLHLAELGIEENIELLQDISEVKEYRMAGNEGHRVQHDSGHLSVHSLKIQELDDLTRCRYLNLLGELNCMSQ